MAHHYFDSNCLGNGLEEISFFSKDIDYDKLLYESHLLEKEESENDSSCQDFRRKPIKHKELVEIWEQGGPVKVLPMPNFDVYPLYFTNFQKLDYFELKELLGNFFTLCEFENLKVRVAYRTEDDLRVGYKELKKDERYNLLIFVDVGDYYMNLKDNFKNNQEPSIKKINHKPSIKKNNHEPSKNKMSPKLIDRWMNNGDVVVENFKYNSYPIQIKNYKNFNYDELMELFSKYGKFTSIAQLENECVQVKFCSEVAARKCVIDLKEDRRYNVRLLFFLKELNTPKMLIKEVVPSKSEDHVIKLLNAEDRIKFDPNQVPVKGNPLRVNRKNKKQVEQKKIEFTEIDANVIYHKKNFENGNIYVKGTPLDNPFLTAPHSYKVWKNKQNHLPAPHPDHSDCMNKKNINYEYYLENMRALGYHSHSSCCDSN